MLSHWDKEEDQAKEKDKDHKQPQTNPSFSTAMTIMPKLSKHFVTKYFNSMSSKSPIMYTPKEKHRCNIIMAQQELNTTECEVLDQDPPEEIALTKW